jgi:N-acetylglucosaminyldiphosphoundecaprenol N-acetyl-beta-D-mannosaminyltransferase
MAAAPIDNGESGGIRCLFPRETRLAELNPKSNGSANNFRFGHLALADLGLDAASRWIGERATAGDACLVLTSNINHLRLAETNSLFRDVVRRSDLNVADGWPLVLASRLLRHPLPGRVAGIDLVDDLLTSRRSLRLAVLGGPPGAAEGLARQLSGRHEIVLVEPLPAGSWEYDGTVAALRDALQAARPNLVLIGVSPPRQELLGEALLEVAHGPIICCGAALEVLAGLRPRAPLWMRKGGLEWAFRVGLEPRRLVGRYLASGVWFLRVLGRELRTSNGTRGAELRAG